MFHITVIYMILNSCNIPNWLVGWLVAVQLKQPQMGNKQGSSCTQNHPYGYGSGSKSRKSRELQMDWWSFLVLAMQEIGVANDSAQPRGIHGPLKWRCNTWYDFLMGMIMVGFSSSSCQLVNMKMCVSIIRKFPVDNHNLVSGGRWFHIRVGFHDRSNLHINHQKSILSWARPPGRCFMM